MKLLFTIDGLRRKIAADPEDEPMAGGPEGRSVDSTLAAENAAIIGESKVVQLRIGLGVLVRQLRLRDGLSIAQLSERAQVAEDDLRQVEHNPHYTARARLIHQLSEYFGVSLTMLSQMSGTTHSVDRALYNDVVKYAAHSDDVSALTSEERETLHAFVAMLNERSRT